MKTTNGNNSPGRKKPQPSPKFTIYSGKKTGRSGKPLTPQKLSDVQKAQFPKTLLLRLLWSTKELPPVRRVGEPSIRQSESGNYSLSVSLQDDEQRIWELYLHLIPRLSTEVSSTTKTVALFWKTLPAKPLT